MEIDLPIRGLDDLEPLAAYVIIYIVFLVFLRLFVWPNILALRKRNFLGKLVGVLSLVLARVMVFGLLLVGFLWSLAILGWEDEFYDALTDLPDLVFGNLGIVISGALLLLIVVVFMVIRPAFGGRTAKK